jgi:hypothetical protein
MRTLDRIIAILDIVAASAGSATPATVARQVTLQLPTESRLTPPPSRRSASACRRVAYCAASSEPCLKRSILWASIAMRACNF